MLNLNQLSISELKDIFQKFTTYNVEVFDNKLYINSAVVIDSNFNITSTKPAKQVSEFWLDTNFVKQVNGYIQPKQAVKSVVELLDSVDSILTCLNHQAA